MKYVFTFLYLLAILQLNAQLHDNMWMFSNGVSLFHVDFRENPPFVSQKDDFFEIIVAGPSVFCDEDGNLLYYTNGFRINNKVDSLLENGDSLNVGYYYNNNIYPVHNGTFFLPAPGDSTRCYFIFMNPDKYPGTGPLSIKVQYALIDRTANNGLGKVLEKNVSIMSGGLDFHFNHAGAVRHANGRDWWIIVPNRMEPKYYRILLTPEGFSAPEEQEIGFKQATTEPIHYTGLNLFSPDGSKYAEFNYVINPGAFPEVTGLLQFYEFDRCTGLLSNPILISIPPSNPMGEINIASLAFSSSGCRFYFSFGNVTVGYALAQYDIESANIEASVQILSTCPPGSPSWTCQIGNPLLALNGRMYVGGDVDTFAWHIIHHPDKIGTACHFESGGGFVFPEKYIHGGAPYLPNYRLGPLDGSACDTLGIDNHPLADFYWDVTDTLMPLLVEFTDNSSYEPTDWFWDLGDGASSTEVNPLHGYAASGTYTVCLTVSNPYDNDTVCKLVTVSGPSSAKETLEDHSYKVFPNPAGEEFHLSFVHSGNKEATLFLYDLTGRRVKEWKMQSGTTEQAFSLQGIADGMYFWNVTAEGRRVQAGKIIVSK